jgi:hypothetical protein
VRVRLVCNNGETLPFTTNLIDGEYTADRLVEDQVIVKLKVVAGLSDVHLARYRNNLRATGKRMCLLNKLRPPKVESAALPPRPDRETIPFIPAIPFIRLKKYLPSPPGPTKSGLLHSIKKPTSVPTDHRRCVDTAEGPVSSKLDRPEAGRELI